MDTQKMLCLVKEVSPFIFQPSPSLKVDSAEIQMIGGCGLFVAITSTMNCKK